MVVSVPSPHPELGCSVLVAECLEEPGEGAGNQGQAVSSVVAVELGLPRCVRPCAATVYSSKTNAAGIARVCDGVVGPVFEVGFAEQLVPDAVDQDGAFRNLLTPERLDEGKCGLEHGGRLLARAFYECAQVCHLRREVFRLLLFIDQFDELFGDRHQIGAGMTTQLVLESRANHWRACHRISSLVSFIHLLSATSRSTRLYILYNI